MDESHGQLIRVKELARDDMTDSATSFIDICTWVQRFLALTFKAKPMPHGDSNA